MSLCQIYPICLADLSQGNAGRSLTNLRQKNWNLASEHRSLREIEKAVAVSWSLSEVPQEKSQISVSRRGGRNKGGCKQMRANANKRRQTLTNASKRRGENASKRRGENASKRKQTRANVDKRKQTLTPPFVAVFYTPFAIPLRLWGYQRFVPTSS